MLFHIPIKQLFLLFIDINQERLNIGKKMGADYLLNTTDISSQDIKKTLLERTEGYGVGCVIECSGAPPMVNNCFSWLRKSGCAVLIGLPKQPLHVENVLNDFIFKAITVKSVHGRKLWTTWQQSEKMLASGAVDVRPVISHEFPLSKFEEAFEVLLSGKACKIIMNPQE